MGKSKSGGSKSKSGGSKSKSSGSKSKSGSSKSKSGDCEGKSKSSGKSKAGKSKSGGSKAKADIFTRHRSLEAVGCDSVVGVRAKIPCACGGKSKRCNPLKDDLQAFPSLFGWW
jgi:hypothetical protein